MTVSFFAKMAVPPLKKRTMIFPCGIYVRRIIKYSDAVCLLFPSRLRLRRRTAGAREQDNRKKYLTVICVGSIIRIDKASECGSRSGPVSVPPEKRGKRHV